MTEKERNERFTKQALAHTDWNGRVIEGETTQELPSLPKDATGQTFIPDNLSEDRLIVFKSVMTPKKVVSAFADTKIVNAMSGF